LSAGGGALGDPLQVIESQDPALSLFQDAFLQSVELAKTGQDGPAKRGGVSPGPETGHPNHQASSKAASSVLNRTGSS
jgi:hypothetical protein